MKARKYLAMMAAAISMLGCLTSCMDDDTEEAMALSGVWKGDFGMSYTYEYRGHVRTYDADFTRVEFVPAYQYATHGEGYQYDYYVEGPYEYQYFEFEWHIKNGCISLEYYGRENSDLNTYLNDYHMDNDYFSGYFPGGMKFRMYKVADHYDWTPYVNIDRYPRENWDRYESRAMGSDTEMVDEETSSQDEGRIIRQFRRY